MPQDLVTSVARNLDLGGGSFLLEFDGGEIARTMAPGQFFMLGIPGSEVLLRRPFSVCGLPGTFPDAPAGALQVLYKVIGRGTALLSELKNGSPLTILGPLGRGFALELPEGVRPVIVAGGIGAAPFPALLAALAARGARAAMFYGARSSADLPLLDWFDERCAGLVVTTDDGSLGRRGLVTEPVEEMLARERPGSVRLYGCGPSPMLRALARVARERGVACELSLEAHMACGFGVCLGCVVPTLGPGGEIVYQRVCVEGPVMPAETLA